MTEPALEVKNLAKQFGQTQAVSNLSFTMAQGETLGLLGANGAGKSTAIHMILGLTTPSSGSVRILGQAMPKQRIPILKRVNFSSAYVTLPGNLRVVENLRTFGKIYGVANLKAKIDQLLEMFEIAPLRNKLTGQLSAGESTRVNLCKALLNEPEVLMLDEPTASLDPDIADKVRKLLVKIQRERQISILYTSHNMKDVEEVCQRVIFMRKGKEVAAGTPEEIMRTFSQDSLENVFIHIARDGDIKEDAS